MIAVIRKELADALRNRWVISYAAVLALLGFATAWIATRDGASMALQMFGRTTATLTNLSLFIAPLIALVIGAASVAAERDRGTLEQLLAQPIDRYELLIAKYAAMLLSLSGATVTGFLPAGILIGVAAGLQALLHYAIFPLISILVIASMLAVGMLASVVSRSAVQAQGIAIAVWFLFVLVYDLLLIGTLAIGGIPTPVLGSLLLFNPIDAARVLVVLALEPDLYVLGPAGIFLMSLFSRPWAVAVVTGLLTLWAVAPLALAIHFFRLPVKSRGLRRTRSRQEETMKRWNTAIPGLVLVLLFVACGGGESTTEEAKTEVARAKSGPTPEMLFAEGKEIYRTNCAPCHGQGGKGDGPASANLDPKPRDHTNGVYMATLTDVDIMKTVKLGGAIKGMTGMPSHPHLKDEQLMAVVSFIRSLSKGQAPPDGQTAASPAAKPVPAPSR